MSQVMEAGLERLQVNTAVCVWYTVRLRGWAVNLSEAEIKRNLDFKAVYD